MRRESLFWIAAGAIAAMFSILLAFGASGAAVIILGILGTVMFAAIGWTARRPSDADWLPTWLAIGFIAKLIGTAARHYMVTTLYGVGDSFAYYRAGIDLAAQWREGQIPGLTGRGSLGTQVVEAITGGLFAAFTPDMLGGFLMFAVLAYLGQLLLYVSFRRWAQPHQLKPYAILILLLPTYAFWPSSIGKDAIVLLAVGATAYFVSRTLEGYQLRWLLGLALALGVLGFVRIHIAGLAAAALIGAALIAKRRRDAGGTSAFRRMTVLGGAVLAMGLVVTVFPDILGVDLTSTQDLDGFTADVVRRTSERGTVASGGAVTSPLGIPGALIHVLFRPFIYESTEIQHFLAATETTAMLGLTIWKLPAILRNRKKWRANPYFVFSSLYVLGFAIAFSVVRNLGIIARQRGQVLAFFLVVIIGLGWEERKPRHHVIPAIPDQGLTELSR